MTRTEGGDLLSKIKEFRLKSFRIIEDATNKLDIERERHPQTFLHDLAIIMTTYLRDREVSFTVDDIINSWGKPSMQKKGAAQIFFSKSIFPSFYKSTIDENELDYLILAFLTCVGSIIAVPICKRLVSTTEQKVQGS